MFLGVFSRFSVMALILISIYALMGLFFPPAGAASTVPLQTPDPGISAQQEQLESPYLRLPVFRHFRKPRVNKQQFLPALTKSRQPLPERVRQIFVPPIRRRPKLRVRTKGPVSVACDTKEMRVRVHTANLGSTGERVHVRLGSCDANKTTEQSVLFRYDLHACGTQREMINQSVVYSNMLHYTSDTSVSGSEMFSVPVQCRFNRFFYSYKIGFVPAVESLKFFKPMQTKGSITLTACDAQWNRLSPEEGFLIQQPMYFEAAALYVPSDERLFVHFCHMTTNNSRVSTLHVDIIDNYGCLIDSKRSSLSRFINSTRRNVVRFAIDAFVLQGKVQKMSIRSVIPTDRSKSCTYNQQEHRWEELYGTHSVCSCCDSSCVPEIPAPRQPVTSEPGAIMKPTPEGMSSSSVTQRTEGIFPPQLNHGIRITESHHKTILPETLSSEYKDSTVMSTLEGKPAVLMSESEPGKIRESEHITPTSGSEPGKIPTPDSEPRTAAPDTLTPDTLTPGSQAPDIEPGTVAPRTPPPDSEPGTVAPRTPPPDSEPGTVAPRTPAPDSEPGTVAPRTPAPDSEPGTVAPRTPPPGTVAPRTPAPDSEPGTPPDDRHGTLVPDNEYGKIALETTPEGDPGLLIPDSNHNISEPENDTALKPESEHGTMMTDSELGILMPENNYGTPIPEKKHGKVAPQTPPVLESERTPPAGSVSGTPGSDTHHKTVTSFPRETVSPGILAPSVQQNTFPPVSRHTELREPYRIFEEVFGLSRRGTKDALQKKHSFIYWQ